MWLHTRNRKNISFRNIGLIKHNFIVASTPGAPTGQILRLTEGTIGGVSYVVISEDIEQPDGIGDGDKVQWTNTFEMESFGKSVALPLGAITTLKVWALVDIVGTPVHCKLGLKVNGSELGNLALSLPSPGPSWVSVEWSTGWESITAMVLTWDVNAMGEGNIIRIDNIYVEAIS